MFITLTDAACRRLVKSGRCSTIVDRPDSLTVGQSVLCRVKGAVYLLEVKRIVKRRVYFERLLQNLIFK